jgi:hypothetical protein
MVVQADARPVAPAARQPLTLTDEQIAEFGALCVMNRHLNLTARELLREFKADRGITQEGE